MFMIGSRWSDPELATQPAGVASGRVLSLTRRPEWVIVVGALLVLLLPQAVLTGLNAQAGQPARPSLALPETLAQGTAPSEPPASDWTPRFLGAAAQATRSYRLGKSTVGVHIAYYRSQTYEHKLVSSQNVLVTSEDRRWNRIGTHSRRVVIDGQPVILVASELLGTEAPGQAARPVLNVWQVYWVDGRFIASDAWAKVHGAISRLSGRGDDGAAVFLYTLGDPKAQGDPTLEAFAQANLAPLVKLLQRTRDAR
jgi:EpsI family protein